MALPFTTSRNPKRTGRTLAYCARGFRACLVGKTSKTAPMKTTEDVSPRGEGEACAITRDVLRAPAFSRCRPIVKASIGWFGSLAVYAVFAGVVFIVHGAEPALMIDHLAYMKQADDILLAHPDGDYWRSINQLHSYAVAM